MCGVSNSGRYFERSPYFNYESEDLFELSKELPLPNKTTYIYDEDGVKINKEIDDTIVNSYKALLDGDPNSRYDNAEEFLKNLRDLLNAIDKDSRLNCSKDLLHIINKHTNYSYDEDGAVKNAIFNRMYKIGVNPKNYIFENTILSIDLARNAANKSKSGKFAKVLSLSNPGAKMVAQLQNAVGKESIAKYANGIKGFASLTGYYLGQLNDANSKSEN